eukprot:TRINITY_DN167_c0_g1_i1.p1 TRINITY_DN167_c0_g1~~TRINITY_DN167_c0_g1_i1.p1  ORF type:complete len:183 (-),score=16.76 TRINITY_DN167_c0_g1_i1:312-860(-)
MGQAITRALGDLFSGLQAEKRILVLGLDNAGKTTILYKFKFNDEAASCTVPTVGFNVETVQFKNLSMTVYDVGGQHTIRPLWRHYYSGTHAIVYVVDCSDRDRVNEAREELHDVLKAEELKQASVLVFANKRDLPDAITPQELVFYLGLDKLRRPWYVQPSVATENEGIVEGFTWVSRQLVN